MKKALIPAALALLALPAVAQAHDATIACDASAPNGYRVVADYTWLNPVTTFGPTSATVVWSDRYRVVLPYPAGCVAPPPPPPVVPPAPPVTPTTPVVPVVGSQPAPPVVAPGEPAPVEPMPRKKAAPRKPVRITCGYLKAHKAGKWSYLARGYYPGCRPPKPPRKYLARVPVTG